LMWKG